MFNLKRTSVSYFYETISISTRRCPDPDLPTWAHLNSPNNSPTLKTSNARGFFDNGPRIDSVHSIFTNLLLKAYRICIKNTDRVHGQSLPLLLLLPQHQILSPLNPIPLWAMLYHQYQDVCYPLHSKQPLI